MTVSTVVTRGTANPVRPHDFDSEFVRLYAEELISRDMTGQE
jgi:hypothetical protein